MFYQDMIQALCAPEENGGQEVDGTDHQHPV